jgi:sugar phosphate isomerase/epimerase
MTRRRWPLGVCELAWRGVSRAERSRQARAEGFDHLDLVAQLSDGETLELPVGAQLGTGPDSGWAWPAPLRSADRAAAVTALRAAPTPRIEPWAGSLFGSDAELDALVEAVPSVRFVIDVGHVAQWGGDPTRFLARADHVQLRQAARGRGQLGPAEGDVDFGQVFERLAAVDYRGCLTIEYFDLPKLGWPLDDPWAACLALAEYVSPLLERR